MRAVLLSIEERSEYVLEYRACAPDWAHYDAEVLRRGLEPGASQVGAALREFQGSWPRKEEAGVTCMLPKCSYSSYLHVLMGPLFET